MIIQKDELAKKIALVKGVVPSKTTLPMMQHILIADGYITASSNEMTVKVRLDAETDKKILLPPKAYNLVSSLPAGDINITADDKNVIHMKTANNSCKFSSMDPDLYSFVGPKLTDSDMHSVKIDAIRMQECMKHVLYAAEAGDGFQMKNAICMKAHDGTLDFVGLNGTMMAIDRMDYEGEFECLIPRNAVSQLLKIGLTGEVEIILNKLKAIFKTDSMILETRLIEGSYFDYGKIFSGELPIETYMNKDVAIEALSRVVMLSEGKPLTMNFEGDGVDLHVLSSTSEYDESLPLEKTVEKKFLIGFDPKVVLATLKAYPSDTVRLNMASKKHPVIVSSEDCEMKSLMLPVNIA